MSNEIINEIFCEDKSEWNVIQFATSGESIEAAFEKFIQTSDDLPDFEDGTLGLLPSLKADIQAHAKQQLYRFTADKLTRHGIDVFDEKGTQIKPLNYSEAKAIVESAPLALFLMAPEFHQDTGLQKLHLKTHPVNYYLCNSEIRSDKKLSLEIFADEPHLIAYASEDIRNDLKTALLCIQADLSSVHNCGRIPQEIMKEAGYGLSGIEALQRAIKSEEQYNRLQKEVKNKPETPKRQLKI